MIYEGIDLPYSESNGNLIVKETENWIFSVVPMIYNQRLCISTAKEHGRSYTAGFCYPSSSLSTAILAALLWNPESEQWPGSGFVKIAYDSRSISERFRYADKHYICRWCESEVDSIQIRFDRHKPRSEEFAVCSACGAVRDGGREYQLSAAKARVLRFPRWEPVDE